MKLFLKEQGIAPFKIPERLEVIDDMPLAGGIKVDKKQLREDIEARLRQEAIQGGGKKTDLPIP
jgi:2,3-dihydroxybenzoate-AMP ligase